MPDVMEKREEEALERMRHHVEKHPPRPTAWTVLTGGPVAGKSSLLKLLAKAGWPTKPELAESFFKDEASRGRSFASVIQEPERMVREIRMRNLQRQLKIDEGKPFILDRALPDVLAFALIDGVEPDPFFERCLEFGFARVFILEMLPIEGRGLVYHDEAQRRKLDALCAHVYALLCPAVERVPVFSPGREESLDKRLSFVRERLISSENDPERR